MEFDDFIQSAWNDHAEHAEDVASRLEDSVHLIESPAHVQAYVRIVTHVFGEHLGRWNEGVELLESLGDLTSCADNPACERAVKRAVATLRYAEGNGRALDKLSRDDRVAALATAACAFVGQQRFVEALETYAAATALAEQPPALADDSAAVRALAVGGNNVAAALEEKADRSVNEARGMVAAARSGLRFWKRAGTWLEEERAHCRLSRSLLLAGDAAGAVDSAERCVDVCNKHDAPAFEQFFAHAALALAQRAAHDRDAFAASREKAMYFHEQVSADERAWCDAEVKALAAES